MSDALSQIQALVEEESKFVKTILDEAGKVIVGQLGVLERLLIGVLTGGHLLLEGVPGLAKTLTIKTLATVVDVHFKRIQFTPDLLPADVIGTLIYNPIKQEFVPKLGPIFANFILADEINRAPAKVQSALLEAMQEKQVTIGDTTYPLEEPFLVLATQNPVDQEGTYPLPEAQIDRFMMKLSVTYPSKADERIILDRMTTAQPTKVSPVVSAKAVIKARSVVQQIYLDDKIKGYILDIVDATRHPENHGLETLKPLIAYGASPRASICLVQTAKAHAFLRGRGYVTPEDIKAIGKDVLRHRVIPSFEAEAEGLTADALVDQIFAAIQVP
ncbi:MAG: AAA family ATPase [Candidatus Margulisiibacteriota bacterium]